VFNPTHKAPSDSILIGFTQAFATGRHALAPPAYGFAGPMRL
jgi:hypothetical protein